MPRPRKSDARQERQSTRRGSKNHQPAIDAAILAQERHETRKPLKAPVKPLTDGQRRYDAAFRSSNFIFGIGPAGTGKTWFVIQRAAQALLSGAIDKIYVTRPAVEVERSMGFLPGELEEKFAPYLTPLQEAFYDAFGQSTYEYMLKAGKIEAVPLAFMRGRTLGNAWLIADEMQNATSTEFKMLLTRIGENARFVINGDPKQIDRGVKSGLDDALIRMGRLDETSIIRFRTDEIVRSGLTQKVVEVYEDDAGLIRILQAA